MCGTPARAFRLPTDFTRSFFWHLTAYTNSQGCIRRTITAPSALYSAGTRFLSSIESFYGRLRLLP
jgi:hypothetical protein